MDADINQPAAHMRWKHWKNMAGLRDHGLQPNALGGVIHGVGLVWITCLINPRAIFTRHQQFFAYACNR
ncbi:UNVERIFIED_CONTAM: hypothetical protein GTU68_017948 [Idotea baltica]|nr:hypothetical protein [Idotea baltica]